MNRKQRRAAARTRHGQATPVGAANVAATAPLLRQALARHRTGALDDAEALYRQILAIEPRHADALQFLGVIARRRGDPNRALELLEQAVAIRPDMAVARNNLGNVLQDLGRLTDAAAAYGKATALNPDYADAHNNLGKVLRLLDRYEEAATAHRRAIAIDPDMAAAHNCLGNALMSLGRAADAEPCYRRAVALQPDLGDAYSNLGSALRTLGRAEEALAQLDKALAMDPDNPGMLNNRGNVLAELGRHGDAVAAYDRVLAIRPDYAEAHNNRGNALLDLERVADAEASFGRAIELKPDYTEALVNRGNALRKRGALDAAVAAYRQGLAIDPDYADAFVNLGIVDADRGACAEAAAHYTRALELNPGHPEARHNRAVAHLLDGAFEAGWRDYMHRPSVPADRRYRREALPADLSGRRVLLEKDQGLGDEIFFLRFAPPLAERGAEITYLADPKIAELLRDLPYLTRVVTDRPDPEAFDLVLSVGDLPYLLGMRTEQDIPASIALPLDDRPRARMRERLAEIGPPPYCGVTWRGGLRGVKGRLFKEVPLTRLAGTLAATPVTAIALQRLPEAGEIDAFAAALGRPLHDLTALNDDLPEMLALLDVLDDYVCVSNTNVHLRAARGGPCRVLIPCPPDFRWMSRGDESPWFPGTRVYRQTADRDWDGALQRLRQDLTAAFPAPCQGAAP